MSSQEVVELAYNLAGPLSALVVSSLVGYYFTCRYAEVAQSFKEWNDKTPEEVSKGNIDEGKCKAQRKVSWADEQAEIRELRAEKTGSDKKNASNHYFKLKMVIFLISALVYFMLELYALSKLRLQAVIPFSMLFFVWSSIYRLRKRGFDKRFLCLIITILVFAGLAVYGGIGIAVKKVVVEESRSFDTGTIIYMVCFLSMIAFFYFVNKNRSLTNSIAASFCCCNVQTMDMTTIFDGTLAGMVGGQSLVLIKLLAEIVEGVVHIDVATFNTPNSYIVLALALIFVGAHSYFFNLALSNLDHLNIALFMPCYRFAFMMSAGVGSAAYLHEFQSEEIQLQVIYTCSMLMLLVVCLTLAFFALTGPAAERLKRKRAFSNMMENVNVSSSTINEDNDLQEIALMDSVERGQLKTTEIRHTGLASTKNSHTNGLWSVGVMDDIGEEEEDEFFLCRDRTITIASNSSRTRAYSKQYTTHKSKKPVLDYNYPDSEHTMVVKQGLANKHADGIKSSWVDPGHQVGQWNIRGPNYLVDRVKIPSLPTRMKVCSIDWLYYPKNPIQCVSRLKHGYVQKNHAGKANRPFMFVVNFMVPTMGNYANYFVAREDISDPVFDKMLSAFCDAEDDSYRNDRFKLIPGVLKGNYIVRNFVGSTPALIGRKLTTTYHRGDNWFEVSIDVGSSRIGRSIMGAVKGYATGLVLHMAYLIESKTSAELPERVLGGVDLYFPVMGPRGKLNLSSELVENTIPVKSENGRSESNIDTDSVSFSDTGYESC